jgi:hypothetical protein
MRNLASLLVLGLALLFSSASPAADIDWSRIDTTLGKSANVQVDVHRYGRS